MIVRYALECETCDHPHTLRIVLGQDASQTHKFACRGCSEDVLRKVNGAWKMRRRTIVLDANVLLAKNLSVFL